jgi:hypothetical protein
VRQLTALLLLTGMLLGEIVALVPLSSTRDPLLTGRRPPFVAVVVAP